MFDVQKLFPLLRDKLKDKDIVMDAVMFDYDDLEDYLICNAETDENNNDVFYFSCEKKEGQKTYSYNFDYIPQKSNISIVSSNGYEYFRIGKPKELKSSQDLDNFIEFVVSLFQ